MTRHFSLKELISSQIALRRGIENIPPPEVLARLKFTAECMEKLRLALGSRPIRIVSGYRSQALNQAAGGSEHSQHLKGEAMDFICPQFGSPRRIALHLQGLLRELEVDQLILESSWIHISFTMTPRYEVWSSQGFGQFVKGIV